MLITPNIKTSIILLIFCWLPLGCGSCQGIPDIPEPDERHKQEYKQVPLSSSWNEQLNKISAVPGKKTFEESLKELPPAEREAILEILEAIGDEDQQKVFLTVFTTFSEDEQSRLFRILLYLRQHNKELLEKLVDPRQKLSPFEKLEVWGMIKRLHHEDQQLVEEFSDRLNPSE
jgi:hypothetical protein